MNRSRRTARNALTLVEVVAGLAAIGVAIALAGRVAKGIDRQWARDARQRVALRAVDNVLERALALPWESLDPAAIAAARLPAHVLERLPDAELTGVVEQANDPLASKRVSLTLSWRGLDSASRPAVRLTGWAFAPAPGGEP